MSNFWDRSSLPNNLRSKPIGVTVCEKQKRHHHRVHDLSQEESKLKPHLVQGTQHLRRHQCEKQKNASHRQGPNPRRRPRGKQQRPQSKNAKDHEENNTKRSIRTAFDLFLFGEVFVELRQENSHLADLRVLENLRALATAAYTSSQGHRSAGQVFIPRQNLKISRGSFPSERFHQRPGELNVRNQRNARIHRPTPNEVAVRSAELVIFLGNIDHQVPLPLRRWPRSLHHRRVSWGCWCKTRPPRRASGRSPRWRREEA